MKKQAPLRASTKRAAVSGSCRPNARSAIAETVPRRVPSVTGPLVAVPANRGSIATDASLHRSNGNKREGRVRRGDCSCGQRSLWGPRHCRCGSHNGPWTTIVGRVGWQSENSLVHVSCHLQFTRQEAVVWQILDLPPTQARECRTSGCLIHCMQHVDHGCSLHRSSGHNLV